MPPIPGRRRIGAKSKTATPSELGIPHGPSIFLWCHREPNTERAMGFLLSRATCASTSMGGPHDYCYGPANVTLVSHPICADRPLGYR